MSYSPTLAWGVECPSRRLLGIAHTSDVWPGPYIFKQVAALARCGAGSKHNRGAVANLLGSTRRLRDAEATKMRAL